MELSAENLQLLISISTGIFLAGGVVAYVRNLLDKHNILETRVDEMDHDITKKLDTIVDKAHNTEKAVTEITTNIKWLVKEIKNGNDGKPIVK